MIDAQTQRKSKKYMQLEHKVKRPTSFYWSKKLLLPFYSSYYLR